MKNLFLLSLGIQGVSAWTSNRSPIQRYIPISRGGKTTSFAIMSHDNDSLSSRIPAPVQTSTSSASSSSSSTVSGQASPPVALPAGAKVSIREITSRIEYEEFLLGYDSDAEQHDDDDRLAMIYFHASWCKSCAKFRRKMDRFAIEMGDWVENDKVKSTKSLLEDSAEWLLNFHSNNDPPQPKKVLREGVMRFASVEWTKNKALCQHLKIERLPTVAFIKKGGEIVEQFECPPSKFCKVQNSARYHLEQQSAMASKEALEHDLEQGQGLIQGLLASDKLVKNSRSKRSEVLVTAAATIESSNLSKSTPTEPTSKQSRLVHSLLKRMSGRIEPAKLHSDSTKASSSSFTRLVATTELPPQHHRKRIKLDEPYTKTKKPTMTTTWWW